MGLGLTLLLVATHCHIQLRVPPRPSLRVSTLRLAANGDGKDGVGADRSAAVPPTTTGEGSSDGPDDSSAAPNFFDSTAATFGTLRAMYGGLQVPKLEEDDLPEAVALNTALEKVKANPKAVGVGELTAMTGDYYKASYSRIMERPAVKEGLPLIFSAGNAAVVLLLVRLLVPRLLAIESMNDIYEFAPELGLPSKVRWRAASARDSLTCGRPLRSHRPIVCVLCS